MYKVFINEKAIFLIDSSNFSKTKMEIKNLKFENKQTIKEAVDLLESQQVDQIVIHSEDLNVLYETFKSCFKYIEAAGGAVLNNNKELLFIYRLEKWDLPKGKIEEGENPAEAAIREVEEECGIRNLEIKRELPSTFHIYEHKGKNTLKKTFWFEMTSHTADQKLTPQTEEGITEVEWLNSEESKKAMQKTYQNIKIIVSEVYN